MKNIKTTYKIILTIAFIILFAVITGGKSLAVTQPRYAPDGESWKGWFCAQSGYSYWNKYSYYGNSDAYDYQLKKTISHSTGYGSTSTEKMYWHMLGYVLNYADEHDAKFVVNHYYRSSTGHKVAGTTYDRAAQDAIWQILRSCSAIRNEFGIGKPASSCGCGNSLIKEAEKSWNNGDPKEKYEFKIEIWKDNLGYKISKDYLRQPLLKINSIEEKKDTPKPITLKFYKIDKEGTELSGAEIKVTTTEGTIKGSLTKSESQNGYFGTLKITPNEDSNDGSIKIKISEIKTPKGYDSISDITLTVNYDKSTGKVTSVTEPTNTDTYKNSKGVGIIKIINKSSVPTVKVHFYKWNAKLTKRLGGAEIDVEKGTNVSEMSKTLYTSSAKKGYLGYVTVIPVASNPGKFKIKVKETTAPAGYNKIPETTLTISYDKTSGKITKIESDDEECAYGIENSSGVNVVRILNHSRIVKNMTILKTDFDGNPLANVKFDVYLNNISYIKIGDVLYFVEQSQYEEMIKENEELDEEDRYNGNEIVLLKVDEEKSLKYVVDGKETSIKIKRLANGTDTNRLRIYDISTNSKGQIVFPEMMISKGFKDRTVYITIYEAEKPEGYEKLPNDLRLVLKYDENITNWKLIERNKDVETNEDYRNKLDTKYWDTFDDNTVKIQLYNQKIPAIQIGGDPAGSGFNKVATGNSDIKVKGAEFTAVFTQDDKQIASIKATSDSNGHVSFAKVQPTTKSPVKVTITETKLPAGWTGSYTKTIEFTYDSANQTWTEKDSTVSTQLVDNTVHVGLENAENTARIEKLTIQKKDQLTGNSLDGVKFDLTFDNVKKVGTTNATNGKVTIKGKEVSNGKIEIDNIEIADLTKNIPVTITETSVPNNYKKIEGTITLTLTRNGSTLSGSLSKDGTVLDTEVSTKDLTVNGSANTVTIDIKNHEVIDLSGQVWLDKQENEKNVTNPDGKKGDKEPKLKDVKVHLYSIKDKKIISEDGVKTDSDGKYKFENIIKTNEGFKIYFEYNGILYDDVGITTDSDAAENASERTSFNDRFKTIDVNGANDGTSLEYAYSNEESKLNASTDGSIPANASTDGSIPANSSIKAYTDDVYKVTTSNIDCALISKHYDLSLDNLIENVEYTINGKKIKENVGTTKYDSKISLSDYYYRYDDYSQKINEFDDEVIRKDTLQTAELEVYVTYKLLIYNQSIHSTNNVSVDYTYNNSKYELESIDGKKEKANGSFTLNVTELTQAKSSKEILIKFRVRKDAEGNLPKEIATSNGLTVETKAEITSYTTQEGALIDVDSQPGNGKAEDDLSKATVNFKLKEEAREISGNVAEAKIQDGKATENLSDKQINDVIVQLIELVKGKDGKTYEYIWQETYTGSNQVKARSTSDNVYTYTNKLTDSRDGQYQFLGYEVKADGNLGLKTGFIPGDYIIRFIYGDGTTLYSGRTELLSDNVAKYNGQDYKSTIDSSYKEEWYKNGNGISRARDNEARRLEVMAFSTGINGELGVALDTLCKEEFEDLNSKEQELLKAYYQSLDKTSEEVKFAYNASKGNPYGGLDIPANLSDDDIFKTVRYYVSYKTWMSAETSKINVGESGDKFTNVSFGLMERPNTELVVEKHITALKITPTGVGVQAIVDAKAEIKDILDVMDNPNNSIKITGVTNGLASILSTRTNRGFWKVETDIEELTQGAKLEVEYTYVIRNKSEKDYLSAVLVGLYNSNPEEYANKLKEFSANYSKDTTIGTYLGNYYYTGTKGSSDKEVLSRVDRFEENLNNQLSYEPSSTVGTKFEVIASEADKKYYTVSGKYADIKLESILANKENTLDRFLSMIDNTSTEEREDADTSITLRLETTLANAGEQGITIPTYLTEVTNYSNAAGRRDKNSVPGNLSYVHSDDNDITLDSYVKLYDNGNIEKVAKKLEDIPEAERGDYIKLNDTDEFWGESIIISKPTGANKNTAMVITIIAISSAAVIGAGIILIKKYALKK